MSGKMLRHLFATCLQDANVDPLVRGADSWDMSPPDIREVG